MAVTGGPGAPEPGWIRPVKLCVVRRSHSREQHGVAASCLEELRSKACDILAIDKSLMPVTLVLEEDGIIVDDDNYFLHLPSNTKFVVLACYEKWTYNNSDEDTAWGSQESFDIGGIDNRAGLKRKNVPSQLKEDLSSSILLSQEDVQCGFQPNPQVVPSERNQAQLQPGIGQDLPPPGESENEKVVLSSQETTPRKKRRRPKIKLMQNTQNSAGPTWGDIKRLTQQAEVIVRKTGSPKTTENLFLSTVACLTHNSFKQQVLIDVPCSDLAQELCQSCATVQGLQNTLQQVLDQREEARQSRQLLELYLRALEKEGSVLSRQEESKAAFSEEVDAVDTGISTGSSSEIALRSQVLASLKEKPAPELSLSSQDLELVTKEDPKALAAALNWDAKQTEAVQQACNQELALRLQQMQSL